MAPRKKPSASSSKKSNSNNQAQPSKFGIQHFFERHSQNALLASQAPQNPSDSRTSAQKRVASTPKETDNVLIPTSHNPSRVGDHSLVAPINSGSVLPNTENGQDKEDQGSHVPEIGPKLEKNEANNSSRDTPPKKLEETDMDEKENVHEVSPEFSKSVKRFKFSPGMFIKQSQDDGVDKVTWRISPVNEKLQSVSKQMPEIVKSLADASRINSLKILKCSQNKSSPRPGGRVEKHVVSPKQENAEGSIVSMDRVGQKKVGSDQNIDPSAAIESKDASTQSPFQTPPSLSYCPDKVRSVKNVECTEASDQLCLGPNKKTLLELLDQVEDVISVEDSMCNNTGPPSSQVLVVHAVEIPAKGCHAEENPERAICEKAVGASSNCSFLVLEVSEKRTLADSSAVQCPHKVIRLLNEQSGEERVVHLWDDWFFNAVAPGDTVNIIGQFDEQGKCDINGKENFIILHPHILVSGTRVATSFRCPRRTVLDERLKYNEHSIAALIGTMLHQIFQAALMKEILTITFLEEYARVVLQKNIESLYACGEDENDVHKVLIDAVPKILNWISFFRDSQETKVSYVDNGLKKLKISEVMDIEEMAWASNYGLKGTIDASVRVKDSRDNEAVEKIMPLEFKTGKAPDGQSSVEHRAQVILYTLLMSERYQKSIDSGLLYYLQSNQTQDIVVQRHDLVGLIIRRNEFANEILKASTIQQLPPVLQRPSICKGCHHRDVCMIYHKVHGGSSASSGLGDVFDSLTNHLTPAHSAFFLHWDKLVDLEAKVIELGKREIWLSKTSKSQNSAHSLSSIILDTSDGIQHQRSLKDNRFIYRFMRKDSLLSEKLSEGDLFSASSSLDSLDRSLRSGDYVILSTDSSSQAVASGVITDISDTHVFVSFSKRLRLPGSSFNSQHLHQQVWRIDKDEFMTTFAIMRFNLAQLFLHDVGSTHLRKMIVDLEAPRFDSGCLVSQDPAISYIWSEKSLNDDQRRAIHKILTAKDYALILGMPGTGKTSTMVHAVKALLMRGASILLTSYTNSAIDNLLIKLKAQGVDFVRIGRLEAVHEEVREHCFSAMKVHSVKDIKQRLQQVKVVAVTCLGITSPLLANMKFDICLMDEAGQTTLPVSLGPLMLASVFVLVGDHYQLPPLVQSTEARENGMGISLFCRLSEAHPQAISALQSQYRMCQGIMELSNALIYGDRLRCGSSDIADAKLQLSSSISGPSWLKEVLDPERAVIFINTDKMLAFEVRDGRTVNNPDEAHIVAVIARELVKNGIGGEKIGIITPYNSQANLIRHAVHVTLEIDTIDKYQGRDKDCILVSFVRSSENPRNSASLLGDWHRINVALTRAKKKLIMVGSCRTLSKFPLLKLLIKKVEEQSGIVSVSQKDVYQKSEMKRCSQNR